MKRVRAKFPYQDYWMYIVLHKGENRRMVNLIKIMDTKERTTISYARYLMSVHLGRFLEKDEHVDHIDDNKLNDVLSNLQILTPEQNKIKQEQLYSSINSKYVQLNCSYCNKVFDYLKKNYTFHKKNGRIKFHCSKQCSYDTMRKGC